MGSRMTVGLWGAIHAISAFLLLKQTRPLYALRRRRQTQRRLDPRPAKCGFVHFEDHGTTLSEARRKTVAASVAFSACHTIVPPGRPVYPRSPYRSVGAAVNVTNDYWFRRAVRREFCLEYAQNTRNCGYRAVESRPYSNSADPSQVALNNVDWRQDYRSCGAIVSERAEAFRGRVRRTGFGASCQCV